MRSLRILPIGRATIVALVLAAMLTRISSAASVSFTIDPARSTYHFVNIVSDPGTPPAPLQQSTILGVPVIPQVPGADYDSLSGTILADQNGGVLTFNGTSTVIAAANPAGPFLPAEFPGIDNFAVITNAATPVGVLSVALRNWQFTILSGTAQNGVLPSAGALTLATTQGYQVNNFSGQVSIVGQTGLDVATTPTSLTTAGGIETLILPVIRLPAAGVAGQLYITGTIVATRQVGLPGDANNDGIVNGQDIALVASNWLATGNGIAGDVNGDGIANGQDIALIASNWLASANGEAQAVPEPSSTLLALAAVLCLAAARRPWNRRLIDLFAGGTQDGQTS